MENQKELIKHALNILDAQDFYYQMDDYAYTNGRAYGEEANMKYFVKVTNQIGGSIRQDLRDLWIATYHYCVCTFPGYDSTKQAMYKQKINMLKEKINKYLE
jgi:hypothetical protein